MRNGAKVFVANQRSHDDVIDTVFVAKQRGRDAWQQTQYQWRHNDKAGLQRDQQ